LQKRKFEWKERGLKKDKNGTSKEGGKEEGGDLKYKNGSERMEEEAKTAVKGKQGMRKKMEGRRKGNWKCGNWEWWGKEE
jgi:hypothetical protein